MAKSSVNRASVDNLHKLLKSVNLAPADYIDNELLKAALASQEATAKLLWEDPPIEPMVLNTHKRVADKYLDGGYFALDAYRISALKALETLAAVGTKAKASPRNKEGLQAKIDFLEHQISVYEQDLTHVTKALWRAMTELRSVTSRSGNAMLQDELPKTEEILRGMASLMSKKTLDRVQ